MPSTKQGSIELKNEVQRITDELGAIASLASGGVNEGNRVIAKLGIRIADGEAPREDKIGALASQLSGLKAGLVSLSGSITVPTADEFTALAETPDPE